MRHAICFEEKDIKIMEKISLNHIYGYVYSFMTIYRVYLSYEILNVILNLYCQKFYT